ncbi:putative bifunctional diguanylate cyclase/phosphodiesterase [uncultured Sphingomonas sp.]|uniref:putative bifunctional diguanylate cyclase/phosphodiesterase n=1 Tax=uncultured Sphingomonas sp. TaxID=158754 RepID=UPI0035CB07C1
MASAPDLFLPVPREVLEAGVELIPIPAAHLHRCTDGWRFEAVNSAYRLAGLGVIAERSPMLAALRELLDRFMASDAQREEIDWTFGDAIDSRQYRVGLARVNAQSRGRCTVTFVDQTRQYATERSLRREMTTDSLTGLPNREGFGDLIAAALTQRDGYAVMVIDLNRFGRLNACLGSLAGDELLITVARRIKGALRARDALARIGGDEFGVLIVIDEDHAEAAALGERIHGALRAPFRLSDYEIGVDCAIGLALEVDEADDGEELIRHAQFAAKRAKASGQIETYQPRAFSVARAQFAMETALRRAIEEERLRLTFQPICCLATGRVTGFESLARWRDADGVDRSPGEFIPVAEESGLIVPLGRWAIDTAARTLAGWDARAGGPCGVRLAVNVSAIQLQRDAVPLTIERALAATGLAGDRFTLELTESALIGDADAVTATLHALKALGPTLAMDDFGTGYSNLAFLHRLPIDVLKIDKSFVTGMLADRDKVAIVRAILGLAQALGKETTAEGVETEALAQTLAALGCTHGQGWFYGRPLEADAAWALIAPATTESAIASTRA